MSSKSLIGGSFWSKPHVQKSSSSGVMTKNVNFEKVPKLLQIMVFPNFLKNDGIDFFDFLHEDRSNPFLTHGESHMSGKILVGEIFGTESGAG